MKQFYAIDENCIAVGGVFDAPEGSNVPENWKPINGEASMGCVWDEQTQSWSSSGVSLDELRHERNRLLGECDYTQLPDCGLDIDIKQLWAIYRQQLRDLTVNYIPSDNPYYPINPDETDE